MTGLKKLNALPINPLEILKQGKYFKEMREKNIALNILIDPLADDALIGDARLLFVPETNHCHVKTTVLGDDVKLPSLKKATFNVIVVSNEIEGKRALTHRKLVQDAVSALIVAEVPYMILTRSESISALSHTLSTEPINIISAQNYETMMVHIARWCAQSLSDARLALAANFEFLRHAIATEFIKTTSLQNGVVGGVAFIPGADMPIMTLNQIKMVLQIAAAYGEPMDMQRVKEIVTVVAGAFLSRTIARQLVAFIPGVGWVIKAGIGYGATYAMGASVLEYFSLGGNEVSLPAFIKGAKDDIAARAREIAAQREEEPSEVRHEMLRLAQDAAHETKRLYIESKGSRG